jgi:hypothetical protein
MISLSLIQKHRITVYRSIVPIIIPVCACTCTYIAIEIMLHVHFVILSMKCFKQQGNSLALVDIKLCIRIESRDISKDIYTLSDRICEVLFVS